MEKFVLLVDYLHLKAGDTTHSKKLVRDSGYLCHLWHDGTKPLSRDVRNIKDLKDELSRCEDRIINLKKLLGNEIKDDR
jgi:hypothetical protein